MTAARHAGSRPARGRAQRGANLVESGLVLVAFLFLVFGIMELGRLAFAYNFVERAAVEGARWASVRGSSCSAPATNQTISAYISRWASGLSPSSIAVVTTWTPDNNPGGQVKVQVNYTWSSAIGNLLPSRITLRGSSSMVILQ